MMKMTRNKQTTIRVKESVLELADSLKSRTGYSRADIFELGVYLLDEGKTVDCIIEQRILDGIIEENKLLQNQLKMVEENLSTQIQNLQLRRKATEVQPTTYEESNVEKASEKIIGVFNTRIDVQKHYSTPEPMGVEFFEKISKDYSVPMDALMSNLESKGFDDEKFETAGISTRQRWKGYADLRKESIV